MTRSMDEVGNEVVRDILRAAEMRALQRMTSVVRQMEDVLMRIEKLHSQMTDSLTILRAADELKQEMDEEETRDDAD